MSWVAAPVLLAASLLPESLRKRLGLETAGLAGATLVTGALQIAGALVLLWLGYRGYHQRTMQAEGAAPGVSGAIVLGAASWIGFLLFSPTGWLGIYLFAEGVIRSASGVAGAACASLGPFVLERFWLADRARRAERALPPIVADEVRELGDGRLEIWTCRNRGWDDLTTFELDGQFHRMIEHRTLERGARPHVYVLGPIPRGWIFRKRVLYSSTAILEERSSSR